MKATSQLSQRAEAHYLAAHDAAEDLRRELPVSISRADHHRILPKSSRAHSVGGLPVAVSHRVDCGKIIAFAAVDSRDSYKIAHTQDDSGR